MELKDVVGFYLGAYVYVFTPESVTDGFLTKYLKDYPEGQYKIQLSLKNMEEMLFKGYAPILRPLSDMTEEEASEMWLLLGWNERIPKEHRAEDIIREFTVIEEDNGTTNNAHWGYFIMIMPYLLKQGFDLFDLISTGQAINSTTLNPLKK